MTTPTLSQPKGKDGAPATRRGGALPATPRVRVNNDDSHPFPTEGKGWGTHIVGC